MPDVVVGAGHNGLVAACYLARAGRDVVVLEALAEPGGGCRTAETVPGFRFDLHSVAHNLIQLTAIPEELDLAGAGLVYREMDPFAVAVRADGRIVRFHRSIKQTVAGIAEHDAEEAREYEAFVDLGRRLVQAAAPIVRGERLAVAFPRQLLAAARAARHGPATVLTDLLSPYDALVRRRLRSDLTRGPVAAFAAHGGEGPETAGGAIFAFWQAAYHLYGQWHAEGGSGALTASLVARLRSLGGDVRCASPVVAIEAPGGRVSSVRLAGGERVAADAVIAAIDPHVAVRQLLTPTTDGLRRDLAGARRGNVVQAVVHVAVDGLPAYDGAGAGDWNGMQSFVDSLDDLVAAWRLAAAGLLPDRLPVYAFTPSVHDATLAPAGHHTVYVASPAAPAEIRGGWAGVEDEFVERCLDEVERRAPGFRSSVLGTAVRTPARMIEDEGWPGAHPMHLGQTLNQLGPFRPTRRLAGHRTPVAGLYLSGAGTAPTGGVLGTPGKRAAHALLDDTRHRRPSG